MGLSKIKRPSENNLKDGIVYEYVTPALSAFWFCIIDFPIAFSIRLPKRLRRSSKNKSNSSRLNRLAESAWLSSS